MCVARGGGGRGRGRGIISVGVYNQQFMVSSP